VKLCGNFLIASSIEAIGEAVALSEKNVSMCIGLYSYLYLDSVNTTNNI
jgi:hypothetical protein